VVGGPLVAGDPVSGRCYHSPNESCGRCDGWSEVRELEERVEKLEAECAELREKLKAAEARAGSGGA